MLQNRGTFDQESAEGGSVKGWEAPGKQEKLPDRWGCAKGLSEYSWVIEL